MSLQVANPADDAFPITPNDGAGLTIVPRFLTVSVGGTLKVDTRAGSVGITITVPAGRVDLGVTKVYATGTSATGITGYV